MPAGRPRVVPPLADMPAVGDVYEQRYVENPRPLTIERIIRNPDMTVTYLMSKEGGRWRTAHVMERTLKVHYRRIYQAPRTRVYVAAKTVLLFEDLLVERKEGQWS